MQDTVKTKSLEGHNGKVVHIPTRYWPDLELYVSSLELDRVEKRQERPLIIFVCILLVVAVMLQVVLAETPDLCNRKLIATVEIVCFVSLFCVVVR